MKLGLKLKLFNRRQKWIFREYLTSSSLPYITSNDNAYITKNKG